jgi:hypothetical protein
VPLTLSNENPSTMLQRILNDLCTIQKGGEL